MKLPLTKNDIIDVFYMCNDRGFIDYCQIVSYISNHIYGKIKPYGCLSLVNLLYTDEYIILILHRNVSRETFLLSFSVLLFNSLDIYLYFFSNGDTHSICNLRWC